MSFSSAGIQEMERWQFCRKTQPPSRMASCMRRVAMGAWPWPSEHVSSLRPSCEARLSTCAVGSTPGLSTKTSGVMVELESKMALRSKAGGSVNLGASAAAT